MTSSRFGRATRGQKPKDTELELDVIIGVMISLDWCAQNAVVQYFMCECGSASASTGRYILTADVPNSYARNRGCIATTYQSEEFHARDR